LKALQQRPNAYDHARIRRALKDEGAEVDYLAASDSIEFMFRLAKKQGLQGKNMSTFLQVNTILPEEHCQFMV
jgi:hypothetical protein